MTDTSNIINNVEQQELQSVSELIESISQLEIECTKEHRGEIDRAVKFMEAAGADFDELKRVEFYASHEGLLMEYERALTRIDSRTGLPYVTSGHFLWVGERTRDLDGAHVDFFSRWYRAQLWRIA